MLANPRYLNYLASQKLFDNEEFLAYLQYLHYFRQPKYLPYLQYVPIKRRAWCDADTCNRYPGPTLRALELLQEEQFRKEILSPAVTERLWNEGLEAALGS